MIGNHIQAGALLAVVFVGAGFHTTAHGDLLFIVLLDDVCEVFSVTTEHSNRIPRCACVLPLLGLLIEAPVRLSSTKREARFTILRELKSPYFADICFK